MFYRDCIVYKAETLKLMYVSLVSAIMASWRTAWWLLLNIRHDSCTYTQALSNACLGETPMLSMFLYPKGP